MNRQQHPVDRRFVNEVHQGMILSRLVGLSSFLCKFFRKNFMGRGTSPFVELVALKLHLIKVPT